MKKILGLLVFIIIFSTSITYGNEYIIGIVDFNAIIMLHPDMMTYNPEEKAFILDEKQSGDYSRSEKVNRIKSQITDLQNQINVIKKKIEELDIEFDNNRKKAKQDYNNNIKNEIGTDTLLLQKTIYNKEMVRLDDLYLNNYKKYQRNILDYETKISRLQQYIGIAGLTSSEETKQKIKAIIKEVRGMINKVSKKYGFSVVLNSSGERALKSNMKNSEEPCITFSFKDIVNMELVYGEEASHRKDDILFEIKDKTREWLANEKEILGEYHDLIPTLGIITGGKDISKEVLLELYTKYKIKFETSQAIVDSIF